MSLIDDVIVNAAAAVESMSKMATEVVDKSRARVSSVELRKKISTQFETLGRYVYDTTTTNTTDQEVVKSYVNEISDLISQLKVLQDTLNEACEKSVCTRCGAANTADSLFCKFCGSPLENSTPYTVPTTQFEQIVSAPIQTPVPNNAPVSSGDSVQPTEPQTESAPTTDLPVESVKPEGISLDKAD